jgi:hypothetical protein
LGQEGEEKGGEGDYQGELEVDYCQDLEILGIRLCQNMFYLYTADVPGSPGVWSGFGGELSGFPESSNSPVSEHAFTFALRTYRVWKVEVKVPHL